VNRRELLRLGSAWTAAGLLGARDGFGQAPELRDTLPVDPLFRPDAVQERAVATAADNDPVVTGVERRLKCTCGCNLDVYTCRTTDFTCAYSPELHKEVLALRAAGTSPDQVVDAFVAKYGEQVLMAPIPSGFNLAGYLLPGAAVALAGAALGFLLLRRGRHQAELDAATPAPVAPRLDAKPEDDERLRRALSRVQD
jgi:cytochrome c-type biogenesis protein CcmH/NrfF